MTLENTLQKHGFSFACLQQADGLARLDKYFIEYLQSKNSDLCVKLQAYRSTNVAQDSAVLDRSQDTTEFLLSLAKCLEEFIADLFALQETLAEHRNTLLANDPIFLFKESFIKRYIKKKHVEQAAHNLLDNDFVELQHRLLSALDKYQPPIGKDNKTTSAANLEHRIASWGLFLMSAENNLPQDEAEFNLGLLKDWCLAALATVDGRELVSGWISMQLPSNHDFNNLVAAQQVDIEGEIQLQTKLNHLKPRQGFDFEDTYLDDKAVQDQTHYCILCHKNKGDFCSQGFPQKKSQPELGLRTNPLQEILTGCPLEQRISEMNALQQQGHTLAALAMLMIDNPLCPLTGHRICNDCMLSCIYQKQKPVDIPQIESGILRQVLSWPWGVELYQLLVVWNPLRSMQWVMQQNISHRVMVMGMGPAGLSMAHYLTMSGCEVLAADGLQVEHLASKWLTKPIKNFDDINPPLSKRTIYGFGGVAEYGITARWNKNLLTLIYISLQRRNNFKLLDAVRFGGQICVDDAWRLGCDHLTLAVGAGLPREIPIKNSLAPGMHQASDFLMTLQLNAAYRFERLVNLEVSLPAVVIGGGLTAVDSACELQAYYIEMVCQVAQRYKVLQQHWGRDVWQKKLNLNFTPVQRQRLEIMLQHAQEIEAEKDMAVKAARRVNFIPLIHSWGGVTIIYRRHLNDSPAYKRNHDELNAALEQGVIYRQALQPVAVNLDENGRAQSLRCQELIADECGSWVASDKFILVNAKCILVATGAMPNVAYEYEHRGTFNRLHNSYQGYRADGSAVTEEQVSAVAVHCKQPDIGVLTSYQHDKPQQAKVSFIGDLHPVFHGSVVKAMSSAKRSYQQIIAQLPNKSHDKKNNSLAWSDFSEKFTANIKSINRLGDNVLEVVVQAPLAAASWKPGVFYRLQTYASEAQFLNDTLYQAEPLALMAIPVEEDNACLAFIILEDSAAASMARSWQKGQRLALMGPTGANCNSIIKKEDSMLVIGDLQAALFVRSIGAACLRRGASANPKDIILVLAIKSYSEALFVLQLQKYVKKIIWCLCDTADNKNPDNIKTLCLRSADYIFYGDLSDYLTAAKADSIIKNDLASAEVGQVLAMVSSRVLCQINELRQQNLWHKNCEFLASTFAPMQCMMKGICARCLQWQVNPETGVRTKAVYSCSWQYQPLQCLDLVHLQQRQKVNTVLEPLHKLWLDYNLEVCKPDNWH